MTVATEGHRVHGIPSVRPRRCAKCPFGGRGLDAYEKRRAAPLRDRIADDPALLWGCHEDAHAGAPRLCAGFVKAHPSRVPVEPS